MIWQAVSAEMRHFPLSLRLRLSYSKGIWGALWLRISEQGHFNKELRAGRRGPVVPFGKVFWLGGSAMWRPFLGRASVGSKPGRGRV